jgi:sirohydrochlorin ferrochelatase
LPGEESRHKQGPANVKLSLPLDVAEAVHAALEDLLQDGREDTALERAYRILAWRILAARGGSGLTARMAELARGASSVEEYEAARDRTLGPILDGLESAKNRDP